MQDDEQNPDIAAHDFSENPLPNLPEEVLDRYRDQATGKLTLPIGKIMETEARVRALRYNPHGIDHKHWDGKPKAEEFPF